jgi:hypothetical protein
MIIYLSSEINIQFAYYYAPYMANKIAKNAGCEAVGVRGLTGENLSSKVNVWSCGLKILP